ncbi:MAG TPA: LCP family protein [Solirubrobacteraceae bacterium]|nr:LCP family protein [Solirubrobacteraceae bacterium]
MASDRDPPRRIRPRLPPAPATPAAARTPRAPAQAQPAPAKTSRTPAASTRTPHTPQTEETPQYKRYRARRHLHEGNDGGNGGGGPLLGAPPRARGPRRFLRLTRGRVILALLALVAGWLALSLILFLLSAAFERSSPPANVQGVLDPAGWPLTSANNILVLGSDRRPKGSKEPGANTSGPSRSDSIMLIRTGGGHAARLSIPRDTVVEIPGHGLQKINAAYAFGGPALSVSIIKHYLGVPINHIVEVNFENFPQLIDAMGGVDYTGSCVLSRIDGGSSRGGYTLHLPAGTHHLNGKQALALARTRENLCAPNETDLNRAQHQQALFQDMKSRLLSPSSFVRLPWIAWSAPPAIVSDMSGPTLLSLFAALATSGTPPTRILAPSGTVTLPDGEVGLSVSEAERRTAAARFQAG